MTNSSLPLHFSYLVVTDLYKFLSFLCSIIAVYYICYVSPWEQSLNDYLDLYDEYAEERYSHLDEVALSLKEYTPLLVDAIWAFALALNRSEG